MTIFHLCRCSTANERYYFIRERKTVRNCNACKQKEEEKKARKISCGEDSKSVKFNKRTYSMLISRSRHTDPLFLRGHIGIGLVGVAVLVGARMRKAASSIRS